MDCVSTGSHLQPVYVESKSLIGRDVAVHVHWCQACGMIFGASEILDPVVRSLMGAQRANTTTTA
jgi:hypothetical protein